MSRPNPAWLPPRQTPQCAREITRDDDKMPRSGNRSLGSSRAAACLGVVPPPPLARVAVSENGIEWGIPETHATRDAVPVRDNPDAAWQRESDVGGVPSPQIKKVVVEESGDETERFLESPVPFLLSLGEIGGMTQILIVGLPLPNR